MDEEKTNLFVESIYQKNIPHEDKQKYPLVTLTYAQSIDGYISGLPNTPPLRISGKESMLMTHCLRNNNDAILVGIGTVLNDNPQLNTRLLKGYNSDNSNKKIHNPQPIILDSHLKFPLTSKLLTNYQTYCQSIGKSPNDNDTLETTTTITTANTLTQVKAPWIVAKANCYDPKKREELEKQGAKVIVIPPTTPAMTDKTQAPLASVATSNPTERTSIQEKSNEPQEGIDLATLLYVLKSKYGIQRLMVEGGARIINSFLQHSQLVFSIVITIGPFFVGQGVKAIEEENNHIPFPQKTKDDEQEKKETQRYPRLIQVHYQPFGNDIVVVGKPILEE